MPGTDQAIDVGIATETEVVVAPEVDTEAEEVSSNG